MDTSGQIHTKAPRAMLADALRDPSILAQLLPKGCTLDQTGPDAFGFVLKRKFGPIELALPGTITIESKGNLHWLNFRGAHQLFGRANMALTLILTESKGVTNLDYKGSLQASGLAGRLLGLVKQKRVDQRVRKGLVTFKTLAIAAQIKKAGNG